MFPQEPHKVGGCTHNLTQTTQVQTRYPLPVARVLGYYYRMFLAISYGSLSRVLPIWEHLVDTLVLQAIAFDHAPTHEAKYLGFSSPLSAFVEGAGQRACTVPTSTTTLYMQYNTHVQQAQIYGSGRAAALSSRPVNGDGTSRAVSLNTWLNSASGRVSASGTRR